MDKTHSQIFKQGSKTYFYSSIFFPPHVRGDVFKLYSFVRVADDFVDAIPQKKDEFYAFKDRYRRAIEGERTGDIVVDSFVELVNRKNFETDWIKAFLASMEADIHTRVYPNIKKLMPYLHGSAEVVGLMMAKILDLSSKSYRYAMKLGRAMQYVNFIRDIAEDVTLGRIYFPQTDLKANRLENLSFEHISANPSSFRNFVHTQIQRYLRWQTEGEEGFRFIPRRYLIPIKTASEMYKWTARVIWENPLTIYFLKVKPSIPKIVSQIGYNFLFA